MRHAFAVHGKLIIAARAIKKIKLRMIVTTIVCRETSFNETIWNAFYYV